MTTANSISNNNDVRLQDNPAKYTSGYAPVNGLSMYYEIHGTGKPLVLLHGGGSTIQTTFGNILPFLAKNRQIIAVELQSHGRTADIDRDLSFKHDADDVAALLKYLNIEKADFFGFSNGGQTCMEIGIRHPELVNKLVIASAFTKRSGVPKEFFEFMNNATLENMPATLQKAYKEVAPKPEDLIIMHDRCAKRMQEFEDFDDEDLKKITAPVFVIQGDKDLAFPEHAAEMSRIFPNGTLAILPGGHGTYIGEADTYIKGSRVPELTAAMVEEFLG